MDGPALFANDINDNQRFLTGIKTMPWGIEVQCV